MSGIILTSISGPDLRCFRLLLIPPSIDSIPSPEAVARMSGTNGFKITPDSIRSRIGDALESERGHEHHLQTFRKHIHCVRDMAVFLMDSDPGSVQSKQMMTLSVMCLQRASKLRTEAERIFNEGDRRDSRAATVASSAKFSSSDGSNDVANSSLAPHDGATYQVHHDATPPSGYGQPIRPSMGTTVTNYPSTVSPRHLPLPPLLDSIGATNPSTDSPSYNDTPTTHSRFSSSLNFATLGRKFLQFLSGTPSRDYERRFRAMDREADGRISRRDFAISMEQFGGNEFSDRVFAALFGGSAAPNVEKVQFGEGIAPLFHGTAGDRMAISYRLFDPDGSGVVSDRSFMTIMKAVFQLLEGIMGSFVFCKGNLRENNEQTNRFLFGLFSLLGANLRGANAKEIPKELFLKSVATNANVLNSLGLKRAQVRAWPTPRFGNRIGVPTAFGDGVGKLRKVTQMMAGICLSMDFLADTESSLNEGNGESEGSMPAISEIDYTTMIKFSLSDISWNKREEDAPSGDVLPTVPFSCYCPKVFQLLRQLNGIAEDVYRNSFGVEQFFGSLLFRGEWTTLTSKLTMGKSGNFFFMSIDGMFLAKTISASELNICVSTNFLLEYQKRLRLHPNSLLSRMYGMYSMNGNPFLVLRNVFMTNNEMDVVYDLKGSTQGRTSRKGGAESSSGGPLKDMDFIADATPVMVPSLVRSSLLGAIADDVALLRYFDIIDYSLLIGVHRVTPGKSIVNRQPSNPYVTTDGGILSSDGTLLYYIGIIDHLISFGARKKAEAALKSVIFDASKVSVVEPQIYADRFLTFVEEVVFVSRG